MNPTRMVLFLLLFLHPHQARAAHNSSGNNNQASVPLHHEKKYKSKISQYLVRFSNTIGVSVALLLFYPYFRDLLNARHEQSQPYGYTENISVPSLNLEICRSELNTRDHAGNTPLLKAIKRGQEKTAVGLLALGADVSIQDNNNESPLFCAADSASFLLLGLLANANRQALNTPNHVGQLPFVRALNRNLNDVGSTAALMVLMPTSAEGKQAAYRVLLDKNEQLVVQNSEQNTQAIECCRTLLALVSHQGVAHYTGDVLFDAAQSGKLALARHLLNTDHVNINASNAQGTPLLYEVVRSSIRANPHDARYLDDRNLRIAHDIINLLVARGADINGTNAQQETPTELAVSQGNLDILQELLRSSRPPRTETLAKAFNLWSQNLHASYFTAVQMIMRTNVDLQRQVTIDGNYRGTVLHFATRGRHYEYPLHFVQRLIDRGVDINALDSTGQTALQHGSIYHTVADLLKAGADPAAGAVDHQHPTLKNLSFLSHMNIPRLYREEQLFFAPEVFGFCTDNRSLTQRFAHAIENLTVCQKLLLIRCAALAGNKGLVQQLVNTGIDVNANHLFDMHPLSCAVLSNDQETLRLLVQYSNKEALREAHRFAQFKGAAFTIMERIIGTRMCLVDFCINKIRAINTGPAHNNQHVTQMPTLQSSSGQVAASADVRTPTPFLEP